MTRSLRRWVPLFAALSCAAFATGCSASADDGSADDASEVRGRRTDAQARAAIERAARGAIYVSEADAPYTYVEARLSERVSSLTPELVIEKLGSYVENPDRERLRAEASSFASFAEPGECSENTYPGPEECASTAKLMNALKANLKSLKVFYVAPYENPGGDGSPTIFVIGITPEGNIGGVMTNAVWT